MGEIINPYIAGAPVTEQRMFFGREDIFQWIENSIAGQYADHILVVHGQRRVGKTSVLKQLSNRLPHRYIPVFFDLQGRTHTTLDRFLWWLAREIVRVLKQDRAIDLPIPEKDDFSRDLEFFENRFLPDLKPFLADQTLLLTFDEFDNLEESGVKEELARPLVDHLRRLMGQPSLNFIFSIGSSGRKLENMQAAYTEFFKAALYKKISFLNAEQTHRLVTRPVENVLTYDRKAVERIYNLASGHPYFTQLTCHELFARCQQTEQRVVTGEDVEAVLDDVVERGTVNLKFVWDEASDLEKWSLSALAHLSASDIRTLTEYLRKNRVRFTDSDLTSALLHLREKDVLTSDNRFVIQLLQRWLQKNRPIEQVREELTEVNPIANRYIEIGLEFKDSGLYEKAVSSFQEALEISKDNVQAQVNIALTYMDQKLHNKAVVEFEKALSMDDEDVSARAGLCEAHLALGNVAMSKGREKDAALSYQRVLAVNAEHTEARGRMAEIARQRAERSLADGRDEEALSAFAEALKYTPEDDALSARFEEVKKDRQEKVLSILLTRADKELANRNWDSAVRVLQEGLQFSKGDERFKAKLTFAFEQQRAAKLEALSNRASQAEQSGKWEAAVAALQEYLSIEAGHPQVQSRLEHARAKLREYEIRELRERARTLARSERWDESLTAWDEVLSREPADASVRSEREAVEKSRGLAKSYAEGQSAFAKKDYDRSIALFKSIVMEDADYKEATRLLAESIELRRTVRAWWQSRVLWAGIGIVALFALAWGLFRFGVPLLAAPPASQQVETVAPALNISTPSPLAVTLAPTASPVPLPYVWTRLDSMQFLPRDAVNALVIDPNDPGVMYVGMVNAGMYRSIDGGLTWQPIQNGLSRAGISSLWVDPHDSATLYAAAMGAGVYRTVDRGDTWQPVNTGIDSGDSSSTQLIIDPLDGRHLFFTNYYALYETVDGGDAWSKVSRSSCPDYFLKIALHPQDPKTLFAALAGFGQESNVVSECQPGIYISHDSGQTWNLASEVTDVLRLFIDPAGDYLLITRVGENGGLYISSDEGRTWELLTSTTCFSLAFGSDGVDTLYCGGNRGSIEKTPDGGQRWETLLNREGGFQVRAITPSPYDTQEIWAGLDGLQFSADDGQTWQARNSGLGTYFTLTVDPYDNAFLYANGTWGWLYRSSDRGQTWVSLENMGAFSFGSSAGILLIDSGDGTFLFSNDRGETWETITNEQALAYSQLAELQYRLSATGNGVERSQDNGQTWNACAAVGLLNDIGFRLSVDPQDQNRLLVGTLGNGVLISTDACTSWTPINNGLGSLFINAVAMDPLDPNTFYAGTDGGAYLSTDAGQSWGQVNDGLLGATVVYSIAVDQDGSVYAATPYGIFKLEGK